MNRPLIPLLAGLAICVVAIILVVCTIEDTRKNRNAFSTTTLGEGISSVEPNQLMNRDISRSAHRKRAVRENLGILSQLGYVLTADNIGSQTAKGKVKIETPDGRTFRSDSVSISSDGKNILLHGWVSKECRLNYCQIFLDEDSCARIALDGSSESFTGKPLYEPGSTFQIVTLPNKIN